MCVSSTIHGRRLLSFACPKESNQRKGAPSDPRPRLRRGFAAGGRVSPTGHPWPVVEIGAIPRAARVRSTRLFRPPFAASQREPEEQRKEKSDVSHISGASAAGTAALCSSRAPLGRGEQVEETAACTARGRAQDARASDLGTGMCRERTPPPAREVRRHGCLRTAAARVPFSLVTFFWASKRK